MKSITMNGRIYNVRQFGLRNNMLGIFTASGRGKGRSNHIVYRYNETTGGEMFVADFGLTIEQCRELIG